MAIEGVVGVDRIRCSAGGGEGVREFEDPGIEVVCVQNRVKGAEEGLNLVILFDQDFPRVHLQRAVDDPGEELVLVEVGVAHDVVGECTVMCAKIPDVCNCRADGSIHKNVIYPAGSIDERGGRDMEFLVKRVTEAGVGEKLL